MGIYSGFVRNIAFPLLLARDGHRGVMRHLRELESSQWWPPEQLRELQLKRLKSLLIHAYSQTDFYRIRFDEAGFDPSRLQAPDDILCLPMLTKQDIRENKRGLLARNIRAEQRHSSDSGGTTGVRMTFYRDNACLAPKYAATFRQERWTGWNLGDRAGLVWPARQDYVGAWTFKARLRNALTHRYVTLPAAVLSKEDISVYCDQLQKLQPTKIRAFPYALMPVVEYLLEHKEYTIRPRGVISTGEPLYRHQREMMEKAFGCPVFDSYGSRETGLIAQECDEHRGMHLNFESLLVEFIGEDGRPVADGETGELLVTDLFNYGMPLIRYSLGDMGVPSDQTCPCGRGLPMMGGVQGRAVDQIVLADGRRVSPNLLVIYLVYDGPPVGQVQIIQDQLDHLTIKMTNDPPPDEAVFEYYRKTAADLMGAEMKLTFEVVEEIPREKSGKYRFVKSEL